jgi:hypothetical protein
MDELITRHQHPLVNDPDTVRDDWVSLLHELVHICQSWAGKEWTAEEKMRPMRDSVLGEYKAPALFLQREFTRVVLEPVARFAPGANGVVDLARLPTYDDVATLYRIGDEWKLHYVFRGANVVAGPRTAQSLPLDEAIFRRVLDEFSSHAV